MTDHHAPSRPAWTPRIFLRSFGFAFRGILAFTRSEPNGVIEFVAALVVVGLATALGVSPVEWCLLAFAIGSVIGAEMLNTAIESTVDLVTSDRHPLAERAKDLASGAVLVVSIAAAVVGFIVFGPRLLAWT